MKRQKQKNQPPRQYGVSSEHRGQKEIKMKRQVKGKKKAIEEGGRKC